MKKVAAKTWQRRLQWLDIDSQHGVKESRIWPEKTKDLHLRAFATLQVSECYEYIKLIASRNQEDSTDPWTGKLFCFAIYNRLQLHSMHFVFMRVLKFELSLHALLFAYQLYIVQWTAGCQRAKMITGYVYFTEQYGIRPALQFEISVKPVQIKIWSIRPQRQK